MIANKGAKLSAIDCPVVSRHGELKQRPISAPVCPGAYWVFRAARVRRESSPRADCRARRDALDRYGRRAARSPRWLDGLLPLATFSALARDSSSSWAYCSPLNCSLHSTFRRKLRLKKTCEGQSKDSIDRIDQTGFTGAKALRESVSGEKLEAGRSIAIGFGQDGAGVAVSKRDFFVRGFGCEDLERPPQDVPGLYTILFEEVAV